MAVKNSIAFSGLEPSGQHRELTVFARNQVHDATANRGLPVPVPVGAFGSENELCGEDVKTVQELMRHANSRLTLDVCAQALTPAKRAPHRRLVGLIQSAGETKIRPA